MEYGKIIAVTGMPGLFELLSSKSDGAIVRSLEDKNTKFVSSRIHNFSHLESIEVFTVRENVNLTEVFHAMEKETSKVPDQKDAAGIKKYFEKVYPDLDFERVYTSDLKKMAKWFEILKANDVEIKLTQPEETQEDEAADEAETSVAQKPASKKAGEGEPEKETAQAKTKAAADEDVAAPAKKKAKTKESSEEEEEKPKKATAKKTTERKQPDATSGVDTTAEKKAPAKKSAAKKK